MTDLTIRLLVEIERREGRLSSNWTCDQQQAAYLAALRKIVELHFPDTTEFGTPRCAICAPLDYHGDDVSIDGRWRDAETWPCSTIAAVARALGVSP